VFNYNVSFGTQTMIRPAYCSLIQGKRIGTDVTGTIARSRPAGPDSSRGVDVTADRITVGGTTPAARNIISGNFTGVSVFGNENLVQGNFIGTDVTGQHPLPNELGVRVSVFATRKGRAIGDDTIAGVTPSAGNVIAFSRTGLGVGFGVGVFGTKNAGSKGNAVLSNSIFSK
jgi:hypothetical protein